jgi:hypothetical protein
VLIDLKLYCCTSVVLAVIDPVWLILAKCGPSRLLLGVLRDNLGSQVYPESLVWLILAEYEGSLLGSTLAHTWTTKEQSW